MEPVIEVKDLVKIYLLGEVEVQALRGVSLSIEKGGICGHHGCIRIREVNLHEYPGISGPAHPGSLPVGWDQRRKTFPG